MGYRLCFHSAGSDYTVLDPTQIFSLVKCSFTVIDEWGVYIHGNKYYEVVSQGINKLWVSSGSITWYT